MSNVTIFVGGFNRDTSFSGLYEALHWSLLPSFHDCSFLSTLRIIYHQKTKVSRGFAFFEASIEVLNELNRGQFVLNGDTMHFELATLNKAQYKHKKISWINITEYPEEFDVNSFLNSLRKLALSPEEFKSFPRTGNKCDKLSIRFSSPEEVEVFKGIQLITAYRAQVSYKLSRVTEEKGKNPSKIEGKMKKYSIKIEMIFLFTDFGRYIKIQPYAIGCLKLIKKNIQCQGRLDQNPSIGIGSKEKYLDCCNLCKLTKKAIKWQIKFPDMRQSKVSEADKYHFHKAKNPKKED